MPLLFYGRRAADKKRRLYGSDLEPIQGSVFDSFKIKKLAPLSRGMDLANWWWLPSRNHSALSWHDEEGQEQTLFFPQLLDPVEMFEIARAQFSSILPSPITFRISNEEGAFLYD